MLTNHDRELFRNAVKNVKPLKKPQKQLTFQLRPKAKLIHNPHIIENKAELKEESYSTFTPEEKVFFTKCGLQDKTLRQLKQGKLNIEKTIDLHASTIKQAKEKLENFLGMCQLHKVRVALIIHGKGTGKLKSAICSWLKNYALTLAFSSAMPYDGGTGAIYLLLKIKGKGESSTL